MGCGMNWSEGVCTMDHLNSLNSHFHSVPLTFSAKSNLISMETAVWVRMVFIICPYAERETNKQTALKMPTYSAFNQHDQRFGLQLAGKYCI